MGLIFLMGSLGTWAVLLPGVGTQFREPVPLDRALAVTATFVAIAIGFGWWLTKGLRSGLTAVRSGALLLVDVLGLRLGWPRAGMFVGVGLVGALVSYAVVIGMVTAIPFPPSSSPDMRYVAVQEASPWAAGLYFAVASAPFEELIFRGVLLAGVRAACLIPKRGARRATVVLLLTLSSVLFGLMHLHFSVANAVTGMVIGLIFGVIALTCRSVWPAVLAHAGYNFLAMAL